MIVVVAGTDRFFGSGTVIQATGTSQDGNERVTFAGDVRMMLGLMDAARTEGSVEAEVEEWAITRRRPVTS